MFNYLRGQMIGYVMEEKEQTMDRHIAQSFEHFTFRLDDEYAFEHGSWAEYSMECPE